MRTTTLLLVFLAGCQAGPCAPKAAVSEPPSGVPPATLAPAPPKAAASTASDALLFSFVVETSVKGGAGMRVYDDGRVEVSAGGDLGTGAWHVDRTLDAATLSAVRAAIAAEAVSRLPETLRAPPGTPAEAPRAVWQVLNQGKIRTIEAPHYAGVRVPPLEAIHRALANGDPTASVTTHWEVARESGPLRFDVACHPAQSRGYRVLTTKLLDNTLPPLDPAPPAAKQPALTITWREGTLVWTTTLEGDGIVRRGRPDGSAQVVQIPEEDRERVTTLIERLDAADAPSACDVRLKPGQTPADLPTGAGKPIPAGARRAPPGAEPPATPAAKPPSP